MAPMDAMESSSVITPLIRMIDLYIEKGKQAAQDAGTPTVVH